jgi:hypothetical protein
VPFEALCFPFYTLVQIMKKFFVDVPVLIIFWARPDQLKMVFEQVKTARPSKLFLYQDGPRPNSTSDNENINKCRSIVEDIDWDCEVHKLYQEKNYGCDPSEFIAIKWIFEEVDRAIILEDDDVPSQSFFPFCEELLEKYYDDKRINIICGMNHLGESLNNPHSYFFSKTGSIWGWATWKRNVDLWEENLDYLDDQYAKKSLEAVAGTGRVNTHQNHRESKRAHYESILCASYLLNNRLNIIPVQNMISNIGVGENTTHSVRSIKMVPKGLRHILFMKTHEIAFPLKHPKYVIDDVLYNKKLDRIMGNGHPLIKTYRTCESILYRLIAGDYSSVIKGFKRRLGI